jgi:hypothetical protein
VSGIISTLILGTKDLAAAASIIEPIIPHAMNEFKRGPSRRPINI